jgi:hypothetical protein
MSEGLIGKDTPTRRSQVSLLRRKIREMVVIGRLTQEDADYYIQRVNVYNLEAVRADVVEKANPKRVCSYCGEIYQNKILIKKIAEDGCCSPACSMAFLRLNNLEPPKPKICKLCGEDFSDTSKVNSQVYCEDCAEKREETKKAKRRERDRKKRPEYVEIKKRVLSCEQCGSSFERVREFKEGQPCLCIKCINYNNKKRAREKARVNNLSGGIVTKPVVIKEPKPKVIKPKVSHAESNKKYQTKKKIEELLIYILEFINIEKMVESNSFAACFAIVEFEAKLKKNKIKKETIEKYTKIYQSQLEDDYL